MQSDDLPWLTGVIGRGVTHVVTHPLWFLLCLAYRLVGQSLSLSSILSAISALTWQLCILTFFAPLSSLKSNGSDVNELARCLRVRPSL